LGKRVETNETYVRITKAKSAASRLLYAAEKMYLEQRDLFQVLIHKDGREWWIEFDTSGIQVKKGYQHAYADPWQTGKTVAIRSAFEQRVKRFAQTMLNAPDGRAFKADWAVKMNRDVDFDEDEHTERWKVETATGWIHDVNLRRYTIEPQAPTAQKRWALTLQPACKKPFEGLADYAAMCTEWKRVNGPPGPTAYAVAAELHEWQYHQLRQKKPSTLAQAPSLDAMDVQTSEQTQDQDNQRGLP